MSWLEDQIKNVKSISIRPGNVYALEEEGKRLAKLIEDLSDNFSCHSDGTIVKEMLKSLKYVQEVVNGTLKYNGSKKLHFNLWND